MLYGPKSREWSGILIPIVITALTVTAVTITDKFWTQVVDISNQDQRVTPKDSLAKVCSEGSTTVIHENVYAFLLDKKPLPVPGPTIEIDCNGNVSYGVYPSLPHAGSGQREKD